MKEIKEEIKEVLQIGKILTMIGCLCLLFVIICMAYRATFARQQLQASDQTTETDESIYYCNLEYLKFGSSGNEPQLLCTYLADEGKCSFKKNVCYEIRLPIPELMQEEIEDDSGKYEIEITYDNHIKGDELGYIQFTLYNEKTDRTYIAQGAFGAEEDIFLQHEAISDFIYDGQFVSLVLEVQSSQINGPFQTEFSNELGNWCIKKNDTTIAE